MEEVRASVPMLGGLGAKAGADEGSASAYAEVKGETATPFAEGKDGSGAAEEADALGDDAAEGKDEATRPVRSGPPFEIAAVVGCGFLGARIALELASQQVKVRVYDRSTPASEVQSKIRALLPEFMAGLELAGISNDEKNALFDAAVARVAGCNSIEEAVATAR